MGTIFEADCIQNIPSISFYRWHLQNRTVPPIFLIDMSSKISATDFKEKELNRQLQTISLQEDTCVLELKNDITRLLSEKENENFIVIDECRNKIIETQKNYKEFSIRVDILNKRKNHITSIYNANN